MCGCHCRWTSQSKGYFGGTLLLLLLQPTVGFGSIGVRSTTRNSFGFLCFILLPHHILERERERKKKKKITFLTSHQSLRKVTLNVYGPKLTTSSLFPFALISFGCFCTCISSSLTCTYLHKNTHSHTLPIVLESWVHCICMWHFPLDSQGFSCMHVICFIKMVNIFLRVQDSKGHCNKKCLLHEKNRYNNLSHYNSLC